jgi:hypothetical protein
MAQAFRRFTANMAVLMVGTIIALGAISTVTSRATTQSPEILQNREHFYSVIAKTASPNSTSVVDGLAIVLRDKLKADSQANQLPSEIIDFKTVAGAYGGINNALGYPVFDNAGLPCTECGALTSATQAKLLAIKQGNISGVIQGERAATSINLLPEGVGITIVVFFVGGTLLARRSVKGVRTVGGKNIVNWGDQPASITNGYRLLAPAFYIGSSREFVRFDKHLNSRREELNYQDNYLELRALRSSLRESDVDSPNRQRSLAEVQRLMDEYNETALSAKTSSEAVDASITRDAQEFLDRQKSIERELEA